MTDGAPANSRKRPHPDGTNYRGRSRGRGRGGGRWRGRRDKHRRIDAAAIAAPLTAGEHSGYLFSCAPRQEDRAYRDALTLLERLYEEHEETAAAAPPATAAPSKTNSEARPDDTAHTKADAQPEAKPDAKPDANSDAKPDAKHDAKPDSKPDAKPDAQPDAEEDAKPDVQPDAKPNAEADAEADASPDAKPDAQPGTKPDTDAAGQPAAAKPASLDDELATLRNAEPRFVRVDPRLQSAVFVQPRTGGPSIASIVEAALRGAQQSGAAGTRYCQRMVPVHATCHTDVPSVAAAAGRVVRAHFPPAPASFAIVYRARNNSGAKRDAYIPAVADVVTGVDKRYSVDLDNPDVVLIIEIIKTACCVGAFSQFYQLAKLNLHEAACPSEKPNAKAKQGDVAGDGAREEDDKGEAGKEAGTELNDKGSGAEKANGVESAADDKAASEEKGEEKPVEAAGEDEKKEDGEDSKATKGEGAKDAAKDAAKSGETPMADKGEAGEQAPEKKVVDVSQAHAAAR